MLVHCHVFWDCIAFFWGIQKLEIWIYRTIYSIIISALRGSSASLRCAEEAVCSVSAVRPTGTPKAFQDLTWILHYIKQSIIHVFKERAGRLGFLIISRLSVITVCHWWYFFISKGEILASTLHFMCQTLSCSSPLLYSLTLRNRNWENLTTQAAIFEFQIQFSHFLLFQKETITVRRHALCGIRGRG